MQSGGYNLRPRATPGPNYQLRLPRREERNDSTIYDHVFHDNNMSGDDDDWRDVETPCALCLGECWPIPHAIMSRLEEEYSVCGETVEEEMYGNARVQLRNCMRSMKMCCLERALCFIARSMF